MQVQKPEVRQKILDTAQELFFRDGFSGTSTRNIAAGAGISVSNLYKYFTDKEAIFRAVIDPFYRFTETDLKDLFDTEHAEDKHGNVFERLMGVMLSDRHRFVILISRSAGTEYEHVKNEIVNMITDHMQQSIVPGSMKDSYSLEVIASNFIEGVLKIAEKYHDDVSAIRNNIDTLVRYHMAGMSQFL